MKLLLLALSLVAHAEVPQPTKLDDLIRGEMAAVQSYDVAIDDIKDTWVKRKLTRIRDQHRSAVKVLKNYASTNVKANTLSAGPWGAFSKAVVKGAALKDERQILKALEAGETHRKNKYEEAAKDATLRPDLRLRFRQQFINEQADHIKELNSLI